VTTEVSELLVNENLAAENREARAAKLITDRLSALARDRIAQSLPPLSGDEEDELAERVHAAMFGVGGLERFLALPGVENVWINGADEVWLGYGDGRRERTAPVADSDDALADLLQALAARIGRSERRFDAAHPFLNLRLPGGHRLHAVMEVSGRPAVTLRRHQHVAVTLDDLCRLGTVSDGLRSLLAAAVQARLNILVCGGTNAGKTTLLRGLCAEIDAYERLVTIEDNLELFLSADRDRHVVEMETREANIEGVGAITMRDLTREALRMSADRVIVGEVRGAEILDMLQAMSQGNDGSMGTIHARSSAGAFLQVTRYALKAPERLSPEAVAADVSVALDLVVFLHQLADGHRVVGSVREITGSDGAQVISNEVASPDQDGRAVPAYPLRDTTTDRLVRAGFAADLWHTGDGGWRR
jgi:Flp pilus assembly CpaF family ATPase